METQNLLNTGIGTKETPKLKPSKVTIVGVAIKTKTNDGKEMKTPLVIIKAKHPDKEDPIDLTKVKVIKGDKVSVIGLWCNLDEDKKYQKGSSVAELLNFVGVSSLKELEGKEIEAVEQSKDTDYLCLKIY